MDTIQIREVMEHVEVYYGNQFLFSADNEAEAIKELNSQISL